MEFQRVPWNSACIMKALGSYNVLATPGLASAIELWTHTVPWNSICMYNEGFNWTHTCSATQ